MAKIPDGTFKSWQDTQTIHATDYVQERDMLKEAVNDNDTRIGTIENSVAGQQLRSSQLQKITDDSGYPLISLTKSTDDLLATVKSNGGGIGDNASAFKTIWASAGVLNTPTANAFKGLMYSTSGTSEAFVYGTDSAGSMFVNTMSSGTWKGWKPISSQSPVNDAGQVAISITTTSGDILSSIVAAKIGLRTFYAIPGSLNNPTNTYIRGISHLTDVSNGYALATDPSGGTYINTYASGSWKGWKTLFDSNASDALWEGGVFPISSDTITPTKKLSECRTGWQLIWSDANPDPVLGSPFFVSVDGDICSTFIHKYTGSKFSGKTQLHQLPNFVDTDSTGYVVKKLTVYDDRIVGDTINGAASNNGGIDVRLRAIVEY